MSESLETVYIKLMNEHVDMWRPVQAWRLQNNMYCIMPLQEHHKGERWQFEVTAYVICEEK